MIHLFTKGGLEARVANRFLSDTYANKPAAGVKGRLFLPTDGLLLGVRRWFCLASDTGRSGGLKAPPQTGWSMGQSGQRHGDLQRRGALVLEDPVLDSNSPELRLLRPFR